MYQDEFLEYLDFQVIQTLRLSVSFPVSSQAEIFNDSMTLLNNYGWSAVTFDGIIDSPVAPRTSSKSFHFGESDKNTVQELRQWTASQSLISNDPTVSLSSVHPGMYFDLTCQLLAKAVMDSRCILLKVLSAILP